MANHTKFKPEYCQSVIEYLSKGHSLTAWCAENNIGSTATIYNWDEKHPEWKEARELAMAKCQAWWEAQGMDGLFEETTRYADGSGNTKRMNAHVFKFFMINRFSGYKSDKVSVDVDKATLEALKSIQSMSDEDVKKLEEEMKK